MFLCWKSPVFRIKPPFCSLCCKACVACSPCWLVLRYHIKFTVGPSVLNAHCFDCVLQGPEVEPYGCDMLVTHGTVDSLQNQPTNERTKKQTNQRTNKETTTTTNKNTKSTLTAKSEFSIGSFFWKWHLWGFLERIPSGFLRKVACHCQLPIWTSLNYCWWFRNPKANHRLDAAKTHPKSWDIPMIYLGKWNCRPQKFGGLKSSLLGDCSVEMFLINLPTSTGFSRRNFERTINVGKVPSNSSCLSNCRCKNLDGEICMSTRPNGNYQVADGFRSGYE